jgi:hypothetical protein
MIDQRCRNFFNHTTGLLLCTNERFERVVVPIKVTLITLLQLGESYKFLHLNPTSEGANEAYH